MDFYNLPKQGHLTQVAPTTEYYLLQGVPWDDSYNDVRLFPSEESLGAYLKTKLPVDAPPFHVTQSTPVSQGKLTIRVPANEITMYNLNYLMYNNKGHENVWHYCFITGTKWLSEYSCEITFKNDIFQCCAYRANYKACFVERHHIAKSEDTYGANVINDNLDVGRIVSQKTQEFGFGESQIGVMVTETPDGKGIDGSLVGSVYQGAQINHYSNDLEQSAVDKVNALIKDYTDKGKIDAVINIFMTNRLCRNEQSEEVDFAVDTSAFDGYVPKNNKLYTYPYCYCLVDNNLGASGLFKFENAVAKDNTIKFFIQGKEIPDPVVVLRPKDYETPGLSNLYMLTYSSFPQCSWNSDVYKVWLAQNRNKLEFQYWNAALSPITGVANMSATGATVGGFAGAGIGAVAGVATGAVSTIQTAAGALAQAEDIAVEPNTIHGKSSNSNINPAIGADRFNFYLMTCPGDNARAIDSFWEMFGYPIKRITTPNLNSRSVWNYVKTVGCGFDGNMPIDMLNQFRAIFDRGVTIWHTDDIGNYSLNNV